MSSKCISKTGTYSNTRHKERGTKERDSVEIIYCTFGNGTQLNEYYQPVYAKSDEQAYRLMIDRWGRNFAFSYSAREFGESMKKGRFLTLKPLPIIYATKIITAGEMKDLTNRFMQITSASQNIKEKRLEVLLKDVEMAYNSDPFINRLKETIQEAI